MKSDTQTLHEIRAVLQVRDDLACDELLRRAQAVVAARHYQGDDGWDRLKNAIGELEDFIRPHAADG